MSFYNETLLDHSAHPLHRGEIVDADIVFEAKNASCGDNIKLFLKVEDNKIANAGFTGVGCAVSQASADIMLDSIIGKSLDEAQKICEAFLDYWQSGEGAEKIGEAEAFADIRHMPARTKCVTTVWRSFLTSRHSS